jgi:protease YdgD
MVAALARGVLLLLVVLMVAAASPAEGAALAPLNLHHEDVDQSRYPWSAIGKLTNETGGSCSGVMIARDKVLTAAHCLYNYRAQRFVGAEALHFLLGYRAGRYTAHARVARYEIGAGFDPLRYDETYEADWAVLTVSEALPAAVAPLALSDVPAPAGTRAMLAGYAQDRAQALTADRDCELSGRLDRGRLMLHTCRSAHGVSGAPILVRNDTGELTIAGIQIATRRTGHAMQMIAIPAQAVAQRPGAVVLAHAVLPGDPGEPLCSGGDGQPAMLAEVRDRIGLPIVLAATDEILISDERPTSAAPKALAWVMDDRFLFAVQ